MLKRILLEDIHYKAMALFVGFLLWFVANFGTKTVLSVEKELEVRNAEEKYTYRLTRKKVRLKIAFIERFVPTEVVDKTQAFVDVRGLPPGRYNLKVMVENPYKLLVSVEKIEPERVEVYISEAPRGGK